MNGSIRDLFTPEEWSMLTGSSLPELLKIADMPLPDSIASKEEENGSD